MKKNISSYEQLLTSLASDGDCTAFHNLVLPYLTSYYNSLIDNGLSHNDSSEKAATVGISLFKSFIKSGIEDFDGWVKSSFEKYSSIDNNEADFLQSANSQKCPELFSKELMLQLQRYHTSLSPKYLQKSHFFRILFKKPAFIILLILVCIAAASVTYFRYFSKSSVKILFIDRNDKKPLSSISSSDTADTAVKNLTVSDSSIKDSTPVDTVKKADSVPKPKPRFVRKPVIPNVVPTVDNVPGIPAINREISSTPVNNSTPVRATEPVSRITRTNESVTNQQPSVSSLPEQGEIKNTYHPQSSLPATDSGNSNFR